MKLPYPQFFRAATDKTPYLWQCRLACGEPPPGSNCDLKNPDVCNLRQRFPAEHPRVLENAERNNWPPLVAIWQNRFRGSS